MTLLNNTLRPDPAPARLARGKDDFTVDLPPSPQYCLSFPSVLTTLSVGGITVSLSLETEAQGPQTRRKGDARFPTISALPAWNHFFLNTKGKGDYMRLESSHRLKINKSMN